MFSIVIIAFASTYALGTLVKGRKFGWTIFGVMFALFVISIGAAVGFETAGNPQINKAGVTQQVTAASPGGNLEGKEVRFGPTASGTWAGSHDRHVERLGQFVPRQLHAARRARSVDEHAPR